MQATILGCLILLGILLIEPKPPMLENFFLPFFFADTVEMKLTNLSAALILTPLFFIGNFFFYSLICFMKFIFQFFKPRNLYIFFYF